ncbi:MAG: DNA-binding protein [Tissierellales bacterium]|jgi:uncharacterized protein|nr:DNA-binding protein [Tissierellales bacterium]MBN2828412.1 DNA-binding protein [Tissierellales bacterium]
MIYRKINQSVIIRIDKDEELIACILSVAQKENITLGKISGIGAVNLVEIGLYNTYDKVYSTKEFRGDFEIISLSGNLSTKDDQAYVHLHMSIGDNRHYTYGGHLSKAIVSSTAELFIDIIDGKINRYFDNEVGLNLMVL